MKVCQEACGRLGGFRLGGGHRSFCAILSTRAGVLEKSIERAPFAFAFLTGSREPRSSAGRRCSFLFWGIGGYIERRRVQWLIC